MAVKETLLRPADARQPNHPSFLALMNWCRVKHEKDPERRAVLAARFFESTKHFVRRGMKTTPVISVRVRCHGKLHRIASRLAGSFTILDHSSEEQKAFNVLRKLGADIPRCMALREGLAKPLENKEPNDLRSHFAARAVVKQRRAYAYPEETRGTLQERLAERKAAEEAIMRGADFTNLRYPNARKFTVGFASAGVPVGVDIRHVLTTNSRSELVMAGTEIIAALPRAWPRWFKAGLGILSGRLVTGVERESSSLVTVHVADYDPTLGSIVIRRHTARVTEHGDWRLV